MLLRSLPLLLCIFSLLPVEANAQSFLSQGRSHSVDLEKNFRVVATSPRTLLMQKKNSLVPKNLVGLFDDIGLLVLPNHAVETNVETIGIPLWFDKQKGAAGVLTSEIVVMAETLDAVKKIRSISDVVSIEEMKFKEGLYSVRLKSEILALNWSEKIAGFPGVTYAHPNFLIAKTMRSTVKIADPIDPYFPLQWHLKNSGQLGGALGADVHALEAWAVTRGSENVVIAVLDSGFEINHPDLLQAWSVNHSEVAGNGVDDDNNGYIDDVSGWNFQKNTGDVNDGWSSSHGTSVTGLAAARQNDKGTSGTCPNCLILPIAIPIDVLHDAAAFYYARSMGVQIISNSWGYPVGTPMTDTVVEAITDVAINGRDGKGVVILFAMNNINQDDCVGAAPDISSLDSVVAVSSSSDLDKKSINSAWGDCLEILAPSQDTMRAAITTTDMVGQRGYNNGMRPGDLADLSYTNNFGGTSSSTPIAAGVFGLMFSLNENLTRDEALSMVLATADKVHPELANYDASGFSRKYGFGRINAAKALRAVEVFRKYSNKTKTGKNAPVRRQ